MKTKLNPIKTGKETVGQRIARLRKSKGLTQKELAKKIGIERNLVTAYEIGRLHINDEMIIRFSFALGVSTDNILGLSDIKELPENPDLKITKRLKQIENLPPTAKKSLLNTIDAYLKANGKEKTN